MRTCWYTSGRRSRKMCYRHSRKRTHRHISVSGTVLCAFVADGFVLERRLDEERLQNEAKRRERKEQHLFFTAKARLHYYPWTHSISSFECRSSLMRRFLIMRALTSRALTRKTGLRQNFQRSAYSRLRPILSSRHGWPSISTTAKIRFDYGCWSIDKTRLFAQTLTYRKMSPLLVCRAMLIHGLISDLVCSGRRHSE